MGLSSKISCKDVSNSRPERFHFIHEEHKEVSGYFRTLHHRYVAQESEVMSYPFVFFPTKRHNSVDASRRAQSAMSII